ncbi:ethanolamine ammonia-lyase small subunit [Granulicella aggregans]|uniref:Ethanolamine ammonia-lyase small subunit n=1 Tax=Granulicella aggregans TaxID=474949 RepID=A0A7W7ZHA1_9BACT|nr:ethanolamine ammonia-lyase subunit EutC [Granulicella aggregans]MBB5059594.1 ethanolamine ammonia-lyase small subunit [Granulicella aggregans]
MDRRSLSEEAASEALSLDEPRDIALAETDLRALTPARVSLARTGNSITTRDNLAFARDHAQARDAVHAHLSLPTLLSELHDRGLEAVAVKSAAPDRATYLRRPDLGRTLGEAAKNALHADVSEGTRPRLTIIIADGLSALAADRNAIAVIDFLLPLVQAEWNITRVVIAEQARVALGDEIGAALGAQLAVMLIGERPGLSAADSLGAYITWEPRLGRTNAERNCISNIRSEGLSPKDAARRIAYFAIEARRLQSTGTSLKDPTDQPLLAESQRAD